MSVTILDALRNAQYNLCEGRIAMQHTIGKEQLNNAVTLLNKGYSLDDEVEPLLEKYGEVENVPELVSD
jgi:hypothetical protein